MVFYEWAARVPLLVSAPGRFRPRRVGRQVSLLDLYPTLVELAGGDGPAPAEPLEGRSLLPCLAGGDLKGPDRVLGEYLAEAAAGPQVMVREGRYKYIVGEDSPPQLYDLARDPRELENLALQPAQASLAARFAKTAAKRWDFAQLRAEVIRSQRRRRLAFAALAKGRHKPWDYQPRAEAAKLYARNLGVALGDLERRSRLPPIETPPPDNPEA